MYGNNAYATSAYGSIANQSSVLGVIVSDTVNITEDITLSIPILFIDVFDSVTVSDVDGVLNISFINVSDSVTVSDVDGIVLVSIIDIFDSVTVTEGAPSFSFSTHVPWGFHNLQGEISILEGIGSLSAMNTFEKSGIPG